jgi:hypothetical protein
MEEEEEDDFNSYKDQLSPEPFSKPKFHLDLNSKPNELYDQMAFLFVH